MDDMFHDCHEGDVSHDNLFRRVTPLSVKRHCDDIAHKEKIAANTNWPMKHTLQVTQKCCSKSCQEGALHGNKAAVKIDESLKLAELEAALARNPEPEVSQHDQESRQHRHLRFLRAESFDIEKTVQRLHDFSDWWKSYGMDDMVEGGEFDETGPLYVCGKDRSGRPTLIARPCGYHSKSREYSLKMAKRCIFTIQRCIERYAPGVDRHTVIYDATGLNPKVNLDRLFAREVMAAMGKHFPGRLSKCIVINNHWTMTAFFTTIGVLLHPDTRAKIAVCGTNFQGQLEELVEPDHPYLKYALHVHGLKSSERASVPLPPRTPYVGPPAVRLSVAKTASSLDAMSFELGNDEDCFLSSQTTAATEAGVEETKQVPRSSYTVFPPIRKFSMWDRIKFGLICSSLAQQ